MNQWIKKGFVKVTKTFGKVHNNCRKQNAISKSFSERYDKYVIIEYSFKHERCLDFKSFN